MINWLHHFGLEAKNHGGKTMRERQYSLLGSQEANTGRKEQGQDISFKGMIPVTCFLPHLLISITSQ
jgi:hypothetical protein